MNSRKTIIDANLREVDCIRGAGIRGKGTEIIDAKTNKLLGYLKLSYYDLDFDSQVELIKDALALKGYEECDECETVENLDRDNVIVSGYSDVCLDDYEYVDGRMYEYNCYVLDDFWSNSQLIEEMIGADNYEDVTVYHRKGKDWYIAPSPDEFEVNVSYLRNGEIESDYEYICAYKPDPDALKAIAQRLREIKYDLEVKSAIYNRLCIVEYYDCDQEDELFNINILKKEYDLIDAAYEIYERVDLNDTHRADVAAKIAYERFLQDHLKDLVLFNKYTHLRKLKEIASKNNAELIYDDDTGLITIPTYAIRFKNEVYHFELRELFYTSPKRFFEKVMDFIMRRYKEKAQKRFVYKNAYKVFVSIDDSINAGNCKAGTQSFISRHGIDPNKIGGIRGDELLRIAFPDEIRYVERAVAQALKNKLGDKNAVKELA